MTDGELESLKKELVELKSGGEFNRQMIEEFRANSGRVSGRFSGFPMVLIHHIGAKSGIERVNPLLYFPQEDGTMVIVAGNGGAPTNPNWYYNLKAHPRIEVEVGTERFEVVVTEVEGAEREALWSRISTAPGLPGFERTMTRKMPVLVLTRV